VTGTAHRAGPYGHPLQEGRTREPDTGMAWGSLIHFLLEHAMRGPRRDRAHLERLAGWFAFDKPELRRVIPEALDTVAAVMTAEFWRQALAAEERAVEVPFAVRVEEAGGPPRLLYGVIDLAFRTPDGWTLIDYKTDQLAPGIDVLAARYAPQVRAYAEHWRAQLETPTRAALHFIRNAETRWL
jgi:ATP-dependent exoDNAse (exonuclease V) beta subunit